MVTSVCGAAAGVVIMPRVIIRINWDKHHHSSCCLHFISLDNLLPTDQCQYLLSSGHDASKTLRLTESNNGSIKK